MKPVKQSSLESVQFLRTRLKQLNAWPEAGDTFLELLQKVNDQSVPLLPADFDWLERVAIDACQGKDIGLHYPSIFQKLLLSLELRQTFLQTLQQKQEAEL